MLSLTGNNLGDENLKKYKYELHAHTSEISPCAIVPAERVAHIYTRLNYDGIVITDHFTEYTVNQTRQLQTWEDRMNRFISGYETVKKTAEQIGSLSVFFGLEYRFIGDMNDYLIFGMTPDLLLSAKDMDKFSPAKLREFADANSVMIFQAHPCRSVCTKADPSLLDGVETYNGNPRHNSHNDEADAFAESFSLLKCSGSDFHEPQDAARGGIITDVKIESGKMLVEVLKKGNYSLIKTE